MLSHICNPSILREEREGETVETTNIVHRKKDFKEGIQFVNYIYGKGWFPKYIRNLRII